MACPVKPIRQLVDPFVVLCLTSLKGRSFTLKVARSKLRVWSVGQFTSIVFSAPARAGSPARAQHHIPAGAEEQVT